MGVKQLAVLGSTGSIGVTTLDLVARFPDRFAVVSLAAGRNVERLAEQVRQFRPRLVATADGERRRGAAQRGAGLRGEILAGLDGHRAGRDRAGGGAGHLGAGRRARAAADAARHRGGQGRGAGQQGGAGRRRRARAGRGAPGAASTCSRSTASTTRSTRRCTATARSDVRRIILTASGGPFLRTPREELRAVTPAQALKHPTWKMGSKITIDSSTLMNKGLEVIEAHWLFGLPPEQIDVVIHPQSIVHSMVEYVDGSVLAQLGIPDMAIPISYILAYPERLPLEPSAVARSGGGRPAGVRRARPRALPVSRARLPRAARRRGRRRRCSTPPTKCWSTRS